MQFNRSVRASQKELFAGKRRHALRGRTRSFRSRTGGNNRYPLHADTAARRMGRRRCLHPSEVDGDGLRRIEIELTALDLWRVARARVVLVDPPHRSRFEFGEGGKQRA